MRLRATSTASTASAASAVFALLKQASVLATFVKIFQKIFFSLQKSFFSCYTLRLVGSVAQLVEQRIENPRVGGSIPPRATKIQRPTVLSWAFSFVLPACHAGFPHILRVRPGSCGLAGTSPVALRSALSSLEIGANFFAVAHAHGLLRP